MMFIACLARCGNKEAEGTIDDRQPKFKLVHAVQAAFVFFGHDSPKPTDCLGNDGGDQDC
jgi:hypothetical protein